MGPGGAIEGRATFTDKVPSAYDSISNNASYRKDAEIWLMLTTMPAEKRGAALIGHLFGEAKQLAMSLNIADIGAGDGAEHLLRKLDNSFATDDTDQLDMDLDSFRAVCFTCTFLLMRGLIALASRTSE